MLPTIYAGVYFQGVLKRLFETEANTIVLWLDTLCVVLGIPPGDGGDRILTNTVRYARNIKDFKPLELISSAI